MLYREVSLNVDSGGPGRNRGGVGTVRRLDVLADDVELNCLGERFIVPSYGLEGGSPGGCNGIYMKRPGDNDWRTVSQALDSVSPSKFHDLRAARGTSFKVVTGGGGGYGDSSTRPPERVLDDVVNGFVSHEGAERDYGVVVLENDDGTLAVDRDATRRLRDEQSGQRPEAAAAFERIIDDMRHRAVHDRMTPEVEAEVRQVEELVACARRRIEAEGLRDEHSRPGRSLRNPFLNDLAVQFWDSQALERWAARHKFRLN